MFQTPQMVQVSSTGSNPSIPMNFQYQGKQFPFGVQQSPPQMVYAAASSPIVHPISQNYASPPIPILQSSNSVSSVASNATSNSENQNEEGSATAGPTQSPPTPLFPQTFQPVQLVAQPAMMINYNGTNQPLVPVVQVQTPNGPQFQPVYYLDQHFQGAHSPQLPIPGSHKFLNPAEQHPVMQDALKNKVSRSGSLSYDGRSMSFSRDGSEISDSGDGKYYSATLQTGSMRRTSSDASRDGYGSDCSASRLGSEYFGDSHCSDTLEEETKTQDVDVESPDKMFYPTQPSNKVSPPPGIAAPSHLLRSVQLPHKKDAGKECNPKTQTYTSNFLMQYQSSGDCLQCPRELTPEHPTLVEHLNKEQCNNLHRYIDRLGHTKGYQVYHSPDRAPKKRPTSKERQEELYKTELCNYWINGQKCRFGKRCIFAHGQHELRMPKRKVERNRMRPPFRKQVISILNKLNDSNFETLSTELLCSTVEDVRNDEHMSLTLVKAVFNKALSDLERQKMYAEVWRKLLNVHPMSQKMASQMLQTCLLEYSKPRHKNAGVGTMKWVAQLCKKKVFKSEDIVHKILSDMFIDDQREEKVELWCKLIGALKSTIDTSKYFPQLKKLKTKFSARIRFMIMDLEDLKQRNWVARQ